MQRCDRLLQPAMQCRHSVSSLKCKTGTSSGPRQSLAWRHAESCRGRGSGPIWDLCSLTVTPPLKATPCLQAALNQNCRRDGQVRRLCKEALPRRESSSRERDLLWFLRSARPQRRGQAQRPGRDVVCPSEDLLTRPHSPHRGLRLSSKLRLTRFR